MQRAIDMLRHAPVQQCEIWLTEIERLIACTILWPRVLWCAQREAAWEQEASEIEMKEAEKLQEQEQVKPPLSIAQLILGSCAFLSAICDFLL